MVAKRIDAKAVWNERLAGSARRVAETLRRHGPRTRAELVRLTGLSRPTVSSALAELLAMGLVVERSGAVARPVGGRPASVVHLTRAAGLAVGVDVGRRHVRVAVADLGREVLAGASSRLDAEGPDADRDEADPDEVLDLASDLLDRTLADSEADRSAVLGVGLGIPAPITRDGRIGSPALLPSWAGSAPAEALERRLKLPVRVENDANLGALGEYVWGAGRGCANLVYVKIGAGIGAGLVLDGRLFRGASGTAGELGHITLDARGPVCRCGNRGCLELDAGGRALLNQARLAHPRLADLGELVRLATSGDPACRRLLVDAGTQLGVAMGSLANLLNPQRIVLGGELGSVAELLREPLRRGLTATALAVAVDAVDVVPAQLGRRAAALGGVALALRGEG